MGYITAADGTKISDYKTEDGCVIKTCAKCGRLPVEVYPAEPSKHQYRYPVCNKATKVWSYLQGSRYEWNEELN